MSDAGQPRSHSAEAGTELGQMIANPMTANGVTELSDGLETGLPVPVLIELQAQKTPDALAICHGEVQLTYRELIELSNQIVNRLKDLGVARGSIVGICADRSAALVVGALSIMRAGGAYLPLDPSHPGERLSFQLRDASADILLTGEGFCEDKLLAQVKHVIRCATDGALGKEVRDTSFSTQIDGEDLAYLIYTSGSTGRPKGVEITHSNLLNMTRWYQEVLQVVPADRISHLAAVGFDATVWELWPGLAAGSTIYIADNSTLKEPGELQAWLISEAITISFIPTPMAEKLMAMEWPIKPSLRTMMTGGDTLHSYPPASLPFQVVNNYGPTECTILATSVALSANNGINGLPPIGRPITNVQVYIVDEAMHRVPIGTQGEIWIGGRGVGRGYRNRPDLTREKFVPNIFEPEFGARLYRTGDRGCYLPDGQIAFKGRTDDQIKIRGVRMEPGEIEAVLNENPAIRQSVVIAQEFGCGDKRLVAYLALSSRCVPSVRELRDFLARRLPTPMIPSIFVGLDELPLNTSGKIDRHGLPAPEEGNMLSVGGVTAPRDALEKRLQQLWEELLELDNIGVQQDFFELGGDSLMAVRLLVNVEKEMSFKLPLSAFLEVRTIEDLARAIRGQNAKSNWSSLVAVQPLGSKPPLFCVHSHTGDVMYCEYIARGAGPDQPIYGFQSQAVAGKPPHFSTEEMAECYVSELRKIQPKGPYHLFGFCFGGMVAYEMARRLLTDGDAIAYLGIYNAPAPGTLKGWPLGQFSYLMKRTRYEWQKVFTLSVKESVEHVLRNVRNFGLMVHRTLRVDGWRAWATLRRNGSARGLGEKLLSLEEINIAAAKSFLPTFVFPGRIRLYLSPEVIDVYPIPPEEGWKQFAAEGVEKIYVPLDEVAWRGTPFVETVGGSLRQFIQTPRARSAAAGEI